MKNRNIPLFILLSILLLHGGVTYGQLSSGGVPSSTVYAISADVHDVISVKAPDMNLIRSEDEKYPSPYRFAVVLPVNISTETSGVWEKVPEGGDRKSVV